MLAPLYGIEKVGRESCLSPEARKGLQQQHAPAMLERLYLRLMELDPAPVGSPVLPKSQLGQGDQVHFGQVGGIGALFRGRSVGERYESGGERDPAELHRQEEMAVHLLPGRRMAERCDLQHADPRPPV
jgi:hypothetical protein